MSFERMKAIADAVLYEGYVLYPYRASSGKNQVRWQFGVLAPPAFCEEHPDEHAWLETQVLVERGTRLRGRCGSSSSSAGTCRSARRGTRAWSERSSSTRHCPASAV